MTFRNLYLIFCGILISLSACTPDPCDNLDCQNGGVCVEGACECPDGFIGPECVTELDPCLIKPCVGPQTENCITNDNDEAVCNCREGFEGDLCEDLWTDKFVGQYTCLEECNGESLLFPVQIEEGPEFKRVTIVNFHNQFNDSLLLDSKVVATLINPTVVEISNQFMSFGVVEGSGLYQNERIISLNYTITTDTDTLVCQTSLERN